ncbi:hypothetical protein BB560_006981 [Smittium megazygosporum]|uniref:Uncharacterized protein n=1 Tax=Smittium megazygosporum TaxID=133381 RepID=A0A2T9XZR9_9FUNG|nr:hypothetical protein BB560_006981 [Smittium megazygosporum]
MSSWAIHKTSDGRVYYYNSKTKTSSWEKPDELKTEFEVRLRHFQLFSNSISIKTLWKEYMAPGGRKYWYNSQTKETTWDIPDEVKVNASAPKFDMNTLSVVNPIKAHKPQDQNESVNTPSASKQETQTKAEQKSVQLNKNIKLPSLDEITSKEKAESAFKLLLEYYNIPQNSSWEQVMRLIISEPLYNCLNSVSEKKDMFYQYLKEQREKKNRQEKELIKTARLNFYSMLDQLDLTEYSRYRKVELLAGNDTNFLSIRDDERHHLFKMYMSKYIKVVEKEREKKRRACAAEFDKIINSTENISVNSKWEDFKHKLLEDGRVIKILEDSKNDILYSKESSEPANKGSQLSYYDTPNDSALGNVPFKRSIKINFQIGNLDVLEAFQRKVIDLERKYIDEIMDQKDQNLRVERKCRDAFRELLNEHLHCSNITPVSTWQEFFPLIKDDKRYLDILGRKGSTPLELFWDQVEDLNDKVYRQRKVIEDHIRTLSTSSKDSENKINDIQFKVDSHTKLEELQKYLKSETFLKSPQGPTHFDSFALPYIHEQLLIKARRREEEETRRFERNKKKATQYLLSILSDKLNPPLHSNSKWEEEKSRIFGFPNFPHQFLSEAESQSLFVSFVDTMSKVQEEDSLEPGEYVSPSRRQRSNASSASPDNSDTSYHISKKLKE